MSTTAMLGALVFMIFILSEPVDAYTSTGGGRFAGGGIAGVVIGAIIVASLLCLCLAFCIRRRRTRNSYNTGYPGMGNGMGGGLFGRGRRADAEVGNPIGSQPGWNSNGPAVAGGPYQNGPAPAMHGNFQPPTGVPPSGGVYTNGAPQPPAYGAQQDTYAAPPGPPPAAHTKF
ncbi:uncharacterized protein FIBRA_02636 [Fibroporia radiculosa]|uniref:Uncharacterized protein n=1 Tax=Fibroporia radiculosa TaxID=599839 RepID=J4GN07_9APHY|nr:uncharacterized protein FIBRA_02636 [Fibroporia radiculosa]CCM00600.1 predicted protein [Fibroporia radiculosa]